MSSRNVRYINMGSYPLSSSSTSSSSNVYPTSMTATTLGVYPSKSQDISFDPSLSTATATAMPNINPYYNQSNNTHVEHQTYHRHHHHHHTYNPRYTNSYIIDNDPNAVIYSQINPNLVTDTTSSVESATYYPPSNYQQQQQYQQGHFSNRNRSLSASYLGSSPHYQVISVTPSCSRQAIPTTNYGRSVNNLYQNDNNSYSNDFNVIEQYEARIS